MELYHDVQKGVNMKEIVEQIVKLLTENGLTIRGYEGEISGCVIEKNGKEIALIKNESMEIHYK